MPESIHPDTQVGPVHLTVSDLARSLAYYEGVLGLRVRSREGDTARLGTERLELFALSERPGATLVPRTTGLYHAAMLVPSRLELAKQLRRLAETGLPIVGMSDHIVSEAIYVPDPDGNQVEIYRDRPRSDWYDADGNFQLATLPLDTDGLLAELDGQPTEWTGTHADTVLGHVHLYVRDVSESEAFYVDILGFGLMARYGRQASFVSAGGYHHHLGFNTWIGEGRPPAPPGSVGLRHFVVRVPDSAELGRVADRVRGAGIPVEDRGDGLFVRDPSGNGIVLTVGGAALGTAWDPAAAAAGRE